MIVDYTGEDADQERLSHSEVEPTPLGPQGVQRVVKEVSLDGSRLSIDDTFQKLLARWMESSELALCESNTVIGPSLKKHRASWSATTNETDHFFLKKPRASWTGSTASIATSSSFTEGIVKTQGEEMRDRFRSYQSAQWKARFEELQEFHMKHGHCLVPHNFDENPSLSQWVKRQRYQYKLRQDGKHTTLTEERQARLDSLGFVWDSHNQVWEEKFRDLCKFREFHGHANVPSTYEDKNLAIWVKCQRRQYKIHVNGQKSAMCKVRIDRLEGLGFIWNPRRL